MPRLYILRHAKAEKDSPSGRDFDRPLAPRGIEQSAYLADLWRGNDPRLMPKPSRIIASPALRTLQTASNVAAGLGPDVPINLEPALAVDESLSRALGVVQQVLMDTVPALLVGHNHTISDLVAFLSGQSEDLRTGDLVVLDLPRAAAPGSAKELARLRLDD